METTSLPIQCPNCSQELADPKLCQNCKWEDEPQQLATDAGEPGPTEAPPVSSPPPPPAMEEPPRAADSSQGPAESESPKPDAHPAATPASSAGRDSGETVNDKGGIRILEQAKENIGHLNEVSQNEMRAGRDINFFSRAEQVKPEDQKSLYSLTKRRPQKSLELPQSVTSQLSEIVPKFRNTQLIFISCASRELAIEAGYTVISGLGIGNPDRNRVLRYADAATANIDFIYERLLDQLPEEGNTAIVVDAFGNLAESFPNSLLKDKAWVGVVRDDLESNNLFLVVAVSAKYAENLRRANRNSPFTCWEIPFLKTFLEQNYPGAAEKLEADIVRQRERQIWDEDETNFCQQVISFHENDQLRVIVERGGPPDSQSSAVSMLTEASELEKTVIYTATFFNGITAPEFCRVVEALLPTRTIQIPAQTNPENGEAAAQLEEDLLRTWKKEKDELFTKLLSEATTDGDSVRVVSLADAGLREPLRRVFEKKHRFYLMDQFKALQESGIFFYPSIRLAEKTTQIAVEMSSVYPDEFNEGWIVALVIRLRQHFAADALTASNERDSMFHFLPSSLPGALNLAFARVSEICRHLLESPQQKSIVHNSLEYLMKSGCHEEVLWLIKKLKFSQEFDEWYWLKQLLNRADARIRQLTYHYLYSCLKRMGMGVYEGLTKIESWLPAGNRDSYSRFDTFVFQLLIQYCLDTIDRFDARHYGKWPSRYPLFAIEDAQIAAARTSLLARWLLHPGIDPTLASLRIGGTQMTLVGALLAEWRFILLGPNPAPDDGSEYSAHSLFNLLFEQFTARTDLSQRLELLKYWNRLEHDLLKFSSHLSTTSDLRNEVSWKRRRVRELLVEIKRAAPARTSATKASHAAEVRISI